MSERPFTTVRLAALERGDGWSPIRLALDVRSFGINAWTAHEAGAPVVPEHDERPSGHEELYLVVAGHATFTVEGEQVDAPTDTIVFVRDPAATRGAVACEPDTTVLSVGGKAGNTTTAGACSTTSPAPRHSWARPTRHSASPSRSSGAPLARRRGGRGHRPRADPGRPALRRDPDGDMTARSGQILHSYIRRTHSREMAWPGKGDVGLEDPTPSPAIIYEHAGKYGASGA